MSKYTVLVVKKPTRQMLGRVAGLLTLALVLSAPFLPLWAFIICGAVTVALTLVPTSEDKRSGT